MTNMKTNAGIYIRVSTERQVLEGFSLEAQKDNLSTFAKMQGLKIYDVYADEGISGKNIIDRPAVKRLIQDIKDKKIDVVVLYKFDRLTRDMKDTENFINLIREYGILVYTLSGGIVDVSSPSGRFNTRILGAAAQFERENIMERVVDGFMQKAKKGYSLCSATPSYGYDRPKHQEIQTINEKEAEVVKQIFKLFLKGKSFTEIADILNAEKIPTKKFGKVQKVRNSDIKCTVNSIWQAKTIRSILSNVTYIGKVRYGINREQVSLEESAKIENKGKGFTAEGLHEPIIDINTWNKAQEKLKRIKTIYRTNRPKEDVYFCGVLTCGICGHKLTTKRTIKTKKNGEKKIYGGYRCVNQENKICNNKSISHNKVEQAFLKFLEKIENLTEINNIDIKKNEGDIKEKENLKKRIKQKDNKLKELMRLFMDDRLNYDEYNLMKKKLEKEFKNLNNYLKELESKIKNSKKINVYKIDNNIKKHWEYLTNHEKQLFISEFIEEIKIVNSDKKDGMSNILEVKFFER